MYSSSYNKCIRQGAEYVVMVTVMDVCLACTSAFLVEITTYGG